MEPLFSREQLYSRLGHKKSKSLFVEVNTKAEMTPFLSLKASRPGGPISLRDLYIEYCTADPSEAYFAEAVFGEVSFWENIKKCQWFQPYYEEWQRVAEVKRKSAAFRYIFNEVDSQGKNAFNAAKYLVQEPWKDKRNAKVKKEAEETTEEALSDYDKDAERLRENGFLQ